MDREEGLTPVKNKRISKTKSSLVKNSEKLNGKPDLRKKLIKTNKKSPDIKRSRIQKKQDGGTLIEKQLPEVNVYPNNKFGDIARKQGLQTARNWQTVRNSVGQGRNDFINHPVTQGVLTLAPLPSGLEGVGKLGIPAKRLFNLANRKLGQLEHIARRTASTYLDKLNVKTTPNIPTEGLLKMSANSPEDAFYLSKLRLNEGGFDKLGIPEDLKLNRPSIGAFSYGQYKGDVQIADRIATFFSPKKGGKGSNARDYIKAASPVKSVPGFEVNPGQANAVYNKELRQFTNLIDKTPDQSWAKANNTNWVEAHEFTHLVDDIANSAGRSRKAPPGFKTTKINRSGTLSDYFTQDNYTELTARGNQIKNYFGITDPNQPITKDMWNYARKHYVKDIGVDNNMQELFRSVKDPDKFLDWLNPRLAGTAGVIGAGSAIESKQQGGTLVEKALPDVGVYPDNRWGHIARTQGLQRARNWRAVKEGTTKGINDFANDPRTQFVLAATPSPSGFEGIGRLWNTTDTAIHGNSSAGVSNVINSFKKEKGGTINKLQQGGLTPLGQNGLIINPDIFTSWSSLPVKNVNLEAITPTQIFLDNLYERPVTMVSPIKRIEDTPKQTTNYGRLIDTRKWDTPSNDEYSNLVEDFPERRKLGGKKAEFVERFTPIFKQALANHGISEEYVPYLLAQSGLESGWGKSESGKYNLSGIKDPSKKGSLRNTREVINGKDVRIKDYFRDYKDYQDWANHYVGLLNNKRYNAFNGGDFISNVVKGGYATDPNYAKSLRNILKSIKT